MKKHKVNYYLILQIVLIAVLSFLSGYFLPNNVCCDNFKLFEIFFSIFALSITLFTFIQGVIQNCKNSLSGSISKNSIIKHFKILDSINNELKGDVLWIFYIVLIKGGLLLLLGNITLAWVMTLYRYFKFVLIFTCTFLMFDLVKTMCKLISVNAELNILANEKENKDGK